MLLIFDCDGVLRSVSWEAMYAAYLKIAEHVGRDPKDFWQDASAFRQWHDNDWHLNLERMGVSLGSDYAPIVRIFHAIYDPSIVKFSWVDEVLAHLSQKGHVLAVLSGARLFSIRASLAESAGHFSTIKGSDQVRRIKPDPEGILLIMDEIGIGAQDTVMIGDSEADIFGGKNARVKTAGVTWGMADHAEMAKLEPDLLLTDPMSLKAF